MLRLSAFLLFIAVSSQAFALTFKSGESLPSASKEEVGQAPPAINKKRGQWAGQILTCN